MSNKISSPTIPINRKTSAKPPQPSPSSSSPSYRRSYSNLIKPRRTSKPTSTKHVKKILKRCNSDPTLPISYTGDHRNLSPPEAVLFRPNTCTDVFSANSDYLLHSPTKFEGFNRDAKVVVNVTVEGSPGPVRAMVKLGSSVDEAIRLVVRKYSEEGRSPQLDEAASSTFELHYSHFSLQSLNKSDIIGEAGSRSFYLRKSNIMKGGDQSASSSFTMEIVAANDTHHPPPFFLIPDFISRRIDKFIRRMKKLCHVIGCMQ